MVHWQIFIDESGDLRPPKVVVGFLAIQSGLVAALSTKLDTVARDLGRSSAELKFANSTKETKTRVLNIIVEKALFTGSVFYHSDRNVVDPLERILQTSAREIIASTIPNVSDSNTLQFVWDAGARRQLFEDFKARMQAFESEAVKIRSVRQQDSSSDRCVQAADFVAGAVRSRLVNDEYLYYRILEARGHNSRTRKVD
ncbi:MAG: DUF3800 domain-containing protein [Nitrososphaerota archaeon]|nr:DUF3800 domain-containing protein [Nitrososphaerota archaeon]